MDLFAPIGQDAEEAVGSTFQKRQAITQAFLFSGRIFDNPVSPSECKIAFDVVDSPGAVIGEERPPFELKTNGVFWEFDSL